MDKGFPKGGGSDVWEKFPNNIVFFMRAYLTQLCHGLRITKVSNVMKNCSKLAVLGSFSIWNARYSSDWNGGAVLKP